MRAAASFTASAGLLGRLLAEIHRKLGRDLAGDIFGNAPLLDLNLQIRGKLLRVEDVEPTQ